MKKAYYGPHMRFLMNRFFGKKIIGKASNDEIEALCKKISKSIAKIDSKRKEDEIFNELVQKLKIVYTEQLPVFSGAKGIAIGRTIFLDQSVVLKIINNDIKDIEDTDDYQTIIHEFIHKLQRTKLSFKGKSVRGFVEGATELMAIRSTRQNRSHHYGDYSTNFPETAYASNVAIMEQLEIIYGKELVEDYALNQNQELITRLNALLGDEHFELLRKDIDAMAMNKETGYGIDYWQNYLMTKYFDNELKNVYTLQDAKNYLSRLKQMELARIKIEGDDTYKKYYIDKLEELRKSHSELNTEEYEYKKSEFYPELYMNEEINRLDEQLLTHLTPDSDNLEGFQNINLDDYKRYRLTIDNRVFEITTVSDEIKFFDTIDNNNRFASFYKDNNDKSFQCVSCSSNYTDIDNDGKALFEQSGTKITFVNGKMYLSVNPPLTESIIENQEMVEVPVNITKRDIYSRMLKQEAINIRYETLAEKIKRFFTRPKMLPPYSQVQDDEKGNNFRAIYELNPEEKKRIEHAMAKSLRKDEDNKEHGKIEESMYLNHEDI